ncbi:MAG: DNA double-strand break repair nuclease NurA [Methanosphaera stadtmanae]|jgi:NurA-like 5'-3' nuclease|nr:DNA double-strand break repair nuclease NurA [Methanosphaera stadtmanae]
MLESLYLKSIEKKQEITEIFNQLHKDIDVENVLEDYNKYPFKPEKQTKTFIATDGSQNSKKFMSCFIYVIGSKTIVSKENNLLKEYEGSDILTLPTTQSQRLNKTLSRQMDILEYKSTIKTLQKYPDKIDYIYMDGSVLGKLQNFRITNELDVSVERLLKGQIMSFEDDLIKGDFKVELKYPNIKGILYNNITKMLEEKDSEKTFKDIEYDVIEYYEQLELLACIRHLIKYYHGKIIGISKTSTTRRFFNEQIPDAAVLDYVTTESGYTNPKHTKEVKTIITVDDTFKRPLNYPLYNDEIPHYNFITLFARFKDRRNVLKIEIPAIDNKEAEDIMKNIKSILDDISTSCTEGYPHILKKIHNEVVIKNKDVERIINKFTTIRENGEKTGRDML